MMKLSIIIVTYRRHEPLCDTLRALQPLMTGDDVEVVVVDQCPSSELPPDLRASSWLNYFVLDRPGMVAARNVGLMQSRGEIVLFLDDDVLPTPHLMGGHLQAYVDPAVGGVAGRILEPGQTGTEPPHRLMFDPRRGWEFARFDHATPGSVMTSRGCNMSFRRSLLLELGGFDPQIEIFRDDTDMCLRVIAAGYRIEFVPAAELLHLNCPSGGTRGNAAGATGLWQRTMRTYRQYYRHYRDNLYFLFKHFHGRELRGNLWRAYRAYVGLSRWPGRLLMKHGVFAAAMWKAHSMARHRRRIPCSLKSSPHSASPEI